MAESHESSVTARRPRSRRNDTALQRRIQRTVVCSLIYIVQGGLRRGGLTPALAPSMSVITEDV